MQGNYVQQKAFAKEKGGKLYKRKHEKRRKEIIQPYKGMNAHIYIYKRLYVFHHESENIFITKKHTTKHTYYMYIEILICEENYMT